MANLKKSAPFWVCLILNSAMTDVLIDSTVNRTSHGSQTKYHSLSTLNSENRYIHYSTINLIRTVLELSSKKKLPRSTVVFDVQPPSQLPSKGVTKSKQKSSQHSQALRKFRESTHHGNRPNEFYSRDHNLLSNHFTSFCVAFRPGAAEIFHG